MARMELPVLDKFCCIFQLKTGCMLMGIINALLTFILIVILITFAVDIKEASESNRDETESMYTGLYTIIILVIVLLFVKFMVNLIFVYAVHTKKCGLIRMYCIFWIVFMVLFIIGFLKTLFQMGAGHVIAQLFFLAENFYFIVVIRSYLLSINEDGVL